PIHSSCVAGDAIEIALATASPLSAVAYSIRITESGTAAPVSTPVPLSAANIPLIPDIPLHADENGYGWPSVSVPIAADMPSGFYYAEVLENGTPIPMSKAFFVVRAPRSARPNRIVVLWPCATAHAYWDKDRWGQRVNLYDSIHHLRSRHATTQRP